MTEDVYWEQMFANAIDAATPNVVYRPKVYLDGDKWCALYGEDVQTGVVGFGDTPAKACSDFDRVWVWGHGKGDDDDNQT